jgi:hypothetical protein
MIRFLMPAAFVGLLLNPLAATAQDQPQDTPASSTFTYCRFHGHHRSAPRQPSAAGVERQMHSAMFGLIRS